MILRCCAPHKDPRSSSECGAILCRVPPAFEWRFVGVVNWIPETAQSDGNAYFKCAKCEKVNKYRVVAPIPAIAPTETPM